MSSRAADGSWQTPQNLGAGINTSQNELSPFYYPEEKALLFSSNGHKGYGGFDVFFSPMLPGLLGSGAINLGLPFNSSKDDLYLSLSSQLGYLSSNRDNTDGNFDIYTFSTTASEAVLLLMQGGNALAGSEGTANFIQFFASADQFYFQELPLEEKTKVQQYIKQQSFKKALAEKATLSQDLQLFYNSLPEEEKSVIERLAAIKQQFILNKPQDNVLTEDQYYYENLPLEKKEKVRQIVEKRAFQKILQESSPTDAELALFYETLPLEDRERIDRAIERRENFIAKAYLNNDNPTLEDLLVYHTLPTEEKDKIDRMVQARFFQKEQASQSELNHHDLMAYEQLPLAEKQRVDRMVNARRFATKAIEDGNSAALSFEKDYLNLDILAASQPENITIEGKITANNQPVAGVNVKLTSGQKVEKTAGTNSRGEFSFVNVNYHQNQRILFDHKAGFLQLTRYNLEELRVIVLQDTVIHETFDNIYFDTDKYAINDSSKIILDKLADFHFRYPDVRIEISGYADTTGGEPYNKQLSFKRASQARAYLTAKGVNAEVVQILPKGKELPQQGKDLQYSRRIEFALRAVSSAYNPTREIFVIAANPDLNQIARRYQLTLDELIEINPQLTGEPAPFTPVRVLSRRK
jgi:outer membrane protein OmpA-like peptidoglycan-associated protein